MKTLDIDKARELTYSGYVAKEFLDSGRWENIYRIVFEEDGKLWGFDYFEPATEMQEGQDLFESDPVPVYPVEAKEITTTVYEKVQ